MLFALSIADKDVRWVSLGVGWNFEHPPVIADAYYTYASVALSWVLGCSGGVKSNTHLTP